MNKKLKKILNGIGYSIVMYQLTFLSLLGVTSGLIYLGITLTGFKLAVLLITNIISSVLITNRLYKGE